MGRKRKRVDGFGNELEGDERSFNVETDKVVKKDVEVEEGMADQGCFVEQDTDAKPVSAQPCCTVMYCDVL